MRHLTRRIATITACAALILTTAATEAATARGVPITPGIPDVPVTSGVVVNNGDSNGTNIGGSNSAAGHDNLTGHDNVAGTGHAIGALGQTPPTLVGCGTNSQSTCVTYRIMNETANDLDAVCSLNCYLDAGLAISGGIQVDVGSSITIYQIYSPSGTISRADFSAGSSPVVSISLVSSSQMSVATCIPSCVGTGLGPDVILV
ncbi:hypothetical protein AB0D08_39625 [Kitasatospora sp. NPDC048540]|uniref:hypothetical protein n=1 Tax=Kitasatospora sp. NPDC048540 TaxID=3155634 RepID=UPI0033E1E315